MSVIKFPRNSRYFSQDFLQENVDFNLVNVNESDTFIKKSFVKIFSYIMSSLRLTIIHSRVLRRYVGLKGEPSKNTIEKISNIFKNDSSIFNYIDTSNGTMITYLNAEFFNKNMETALIKWTNIHEVKDRNDRNDTGVYKKIFRLKFLFNHINDIYSDKYNIYHAAYIDSEYSTRAILCFIVQIVSATALFENTDDKGSNTSPRKIIDIILIIVTIMYMFFNLPSNYITSSMSHNLILLYIFYKLRMYRRFIFVSMDFIVNSLIVSILPLIAARILGGVSNSSDIVSRSLSVMFVTSLDDSAMSKSESNRLLDPQNLFLKDMIEKVDSFEDSNRMHIIYYVPWVESIILIISVICAYYILFS
jgi:hypothetical protein